MPFLITFLAGCSTLIGYFFIYFNNRNNRVLISSLGFASGVMFFISIFDLIPESIICFNDNYFLFFSLILSFLFISIGMMFSNFIDNKLPNNSNLYKAGMISMIALVIHNVPEGIVTFLTSNHNISLGITLAISIALHNIPEGISISVPIYYSTRSKKKAFLYTFISGMSEFIGAVIAFLLFRKFDNNFFFGCLYSLTSGIMLYISVVELLPTSLKYKNKLCTYIFFIIGIIFIYISIKIVK